MAKFRILINAIEYKRFNSLKLVKTINRMDYLEFTLRNVSSDDYSTNVKYNSQITVEEYNSTTSTYSQIFKGYIRDLKKGSYRTCVLIAHSTAIKLFDRNWTERKQFTNIASNTIFSQTVDGIMEIGTNSITDVITTRFELDNKLKSISQLTNLLGGEWWEDDTAVLADRINLASTRYNDTSVETFTAGSNTLLASDDIDYDKIFNCITVLGKGDGINQAKTQTYGFCEKITSVSVAITSTATSIFVTDATGWATSNGVCYINNEKIMFANRTGNNIYNCTRAYNGTDAYAHSVGIAVWYAGTVSNEYTKTNWAPGSSVETYGVKEFTYPDKRIVRDIEGDPNETCSRVAKSLFEKFKEPVRSVSVIRRNLLLGNVDVGKTITIVDSASGLNSDFKIQSIELHYMFKKGNKYINSLKIITNNLKFNFSTEIEELKKDIDAIGSYEQGATNIFTVDQAENCDTGYPLTLRFYLPEDTKAINKVLLNFQVKNYRTYLTSGETSNNSANGVVQDGNTVIYNGVVPSNTTDWEEIAQIEIGSSNCEGVNLNFNAHMGSMTQVYGEYILKWVIEDNLGNFYPTSDGGGLIAYARNWNSSSFPTHNVSIYIPGNVKNRTFSLKVLPTVQTSTLFVFQTMASYASFSRHTHEVEFGIDEPDSFSNPSIITKVNGTEVSGSPFTATDNTGIDITSIVDEVGAGNWVEIEFDPNQNLRIEASASIQIYLESKV